MGKTCKAFEMTNRQKAYEHTRQAKKLEEFGDYCNGHYLHTWDDGHRYLAYCEECDALLLVQLSEFHAYDDDYYKDIFSVASREEAVALNEQYDGYQIERLSSLKRLFFTF